MDVLTLEWMGKPAWMWVGFLVMVAGLLAFDLGVLHRKAHEIGVRESLLLSGFYIAVALLFGGWVWVRLGADSGLDYLTGFAIEKSLAMDNVFVIALIFSAFGVPRLHQHRVLFWGVLGVIVLRAVMIAAGAALISRYEWALYLFAIFLIFTGGRMIATSPGEEATEGRGVVNWLVRRMPVTDRLDGSHFFVRETSTAGRLAWRATPLFLALMTIEVADVIFAVDSVPAIFAITTDPYIVYTSNIFAILGLRALYFALAAVIHRFAYLKQALAILLVFIGGKVVAAPLMGLEKFPPAISLGVTATILAAGILWSMWKTRAETRVDT